MAFDSLYEFRTGEAKLLSGNILSQRPALMREALRVGIEAFAPDVGAIYSFSIRREGQQGWPIWLLWEKTPGAPFPLERMVPIGTPSASEPWAGGVLHTWPEWDPARWTGADAAPER